MKGHENMPELARAGGAGFSCSPPHHMHILPNEGKGNWATDFELEVD